MVEPHQFANNLNNFYLSRGINPSTLFGPGMPQVHPQVRYSLPDGASVHHPQLIHAQDKGLSPNVSHHLPQQLSQPKLQNTKPSHLSQSSQLQDKVIVTSGEQYIHHTQDKGQPGGSNVYYSHASTNMHHPQAIHPHDKMQLGGAGGLHPSQQQQQHSQDKLPPGGHSLVAHILPYHGQEKMHPGGAPSQPSQSDDNPNSSQHPYHGQEKMQTGNQDKDMGRPMSYHNADKMHGQQQQPSQSKGMSGHQHGYQGQDKMAAGSSGSQQGQESMHSGHQHSYQQQQQQQQGQPEKQRGSSNQQDGGSVHNTSRQPSFQEQEAGESPNQQGGGGQGSVQEKSQAGVVISHPQPFFSSPSQDRMSSPMCLPVDKPQPLNCSPNMNKKAPLMAGLGMGGYHAALLSPEMLAKFTQEQAQLMQIPGSATAVKSDAGQGSVINVPKKERKIGEKCHTCRICAKSFTRSDKLKKHEKTHNSFVSTVTHNEKTYTCDYCDKIFSRSDKLTRHVRTHTGEKPYVCQVCEKAFSRTDKLLQHSRTHTGEKPYACDVCSKAFTRKDKMRIHKRSHEEGYVKEPKPKRKSKPKQSKATAAAAAAAAAAAGGNPAEQDPSKPTESPAPERPTPVSIKEEGNNPQETQEMRPAQWPVLPGPFAFVQSQLMTPVFPNFIPQQP